MPTHAIQASQVSKAKRLAQVIVAVIYCLFGAGIVFGYAALKPVLIEEHVYRDRCSPEEVEAGGRTCYKQQLSLNFMFTVAVVATNVAALPIGAILDKFGPRVCGIIGSFLIALGCTLFAFAWDAPFDAFVFGYLFLALGGPFIFISSFHLSNAFPKYSGTILALLTGAFDASSAVFLLYRLIYNWSGYTFWPKKFFLVYLVVPALIFIVQTFVMPRYSYETAGEAGKEVEEDDILPRGADVLDDPTAGHSEDPTLVGSEADETTSLLESTSKSKQLAQEQRKREISGVLGAMHGRSAVQQVASPWFVLVTLFTLVQMTRINYFVATIRAQYEHLLGDYDSAVKINDLFDAALPLGGVVSVPFIGLILDNMSTASSLGLLVVMAAAIGIFGVIPHFWAAYTNVLLFVVYRPLFYTTISDYAAKVFGFRTFGTVYGLMMTLAGLFNFVQSGLDAMTHVVFDSDPVPVNVMLLCVGLIFGAAMVSYVGVQSRRMRTQAEADAQ